MQRGCAKRAKRCWRCCAIRLSGRRWSTIPAGRPLSSSRLSILQDEGLLERAAATYERAAGRATTAVIDQGLRSYMLHVYNYMVLGLAIIAPDVTPSLALATIESITVLGALHASQDIKSALADRIR